jgi:predicted Zn-dependent protease with MMP-like domain
MMETYGPPLKAAALTAFILGLLVLLVHPPSLAGLGGLVRLFAGIAAFLLIFGWIAVRLAGPEMPEPDFQRLVDRSETLAQKPLVGHTPTEFDQLVMQALDELPEPFRELAERTPVIVSNDGHERHAYGLYHGDTVARGNYPNRIIIYEDTLIRDFGWDPELLRAQVQRTVRHELAHHLGWDERGVRDLGL